jgi:nucleotide-binding universal stress UspA family protein
MKQPFRRILVPHDFSVHARAALRTATELAATHGGRLLVLHAITPMTPIVESPTTISAPLLPPAELVADAKRHLEREVQRIVGRRVPVQTKIEIGDAYHRIMDAARRADVIVMSTAGRTGLAHLLIGSVAEKVVRHSPIPVLTLRPRGGRQ